MKEMIANRYIINKKLGEGGMADVYLAQDSFLNREVAIKILRGKLSLDPVALLRFQREAKLLASLNHPNIAAIHGLEEEGGTQFLVLELVEGQTLAEYIAGSAGLSGGALAKPDVLAGKDELALICTFEGMRAGTLR